MFFRFYWKLKGGGRREERLGLREGGKSGELLFGKGRCKCFVR